MAVTRHRVVSVAFVNTLNTMHCAVWYYVPAEDAAFESASWRQRMIAKLMQISVVEKLHLYIIWYCLKNLALLRFLLGLDGLLLVQYLVMASQY